MKQYRLEGIVSAFVVSAGISMGAVELSGTSYVQEFDGIGTGLPTGWNIYTSATASSLGTLGTFDMATTSWDDTAGRFKNFASAEGQGSGWTSANQASSANRALGIRQSGTAGIGGDPGAAFVVVIEDTLGLQNFNLSFQAQMLSVQGRSTDWVVDYRIGDSGAFTELGVYTDPNVFSTTTIATDFNLAAFSSNINNQADNVHIRIWAKDNTSGGGNRDSFGISNFVLTYNDLGGPSQTARPTGSATVSYAINNTTTRPSTSGDAADSVRASFIVAANGTVQYFAGNTNNALVATGWTQSDPVNLTTDQRFSFDLRLAEDLSGLVDEISFYARRSAAGPTNLYIYSSEKPDSDFSLLAQSTGTFPQDTLQLFTFSDLDLEFEGVRYFRVYGDGATASTGNLRFDDLAINLTVVPEPSTVLAMALGFGLLAHRIRRRTFSA